MRKIVANAGTATGLLLAEASCEDIMAHPQFQAAVAGIRAQLVKSLSAQELESCPAFQTVLAQKVGDGVKANIAAMTPDQIVSTEPFKTVLETKVRESIVSSDNAKQFVSMLKEVTAASVGTQTGKEDKPTMPEHRPSDSFHEDSAALDRAAKQIIAGNPGMSYGEALIVASQSTNYRKGASA